MRQLLIIAYAFPPFPAPGSARPWRFYKFLPEFGYETHVLTASRPEQVLPRITFVPPLEVSFAERVLRQFFFPADNDVLWIRPAIAAAERLIAETPFDAVLSTIPPIHGHTVAYLLKKRTGLPWIADYRDPVVGNPLRTYRGLPRWVDGLMERHFCQAANLVVTVTDRLQQEWIQRYPEAAAKTVVIWNGFDPEENIAPKPLPLRSYRVLAHIGSFYLGRHPIIPMTAIARLIRRGILDPARLRLRLIGSLDLAIRRNNQQLFDELIEIGCLECLPPVPRVQALDLMMEADQLMLADNNNADIGHTVPAKLFEYVRVGRPILALTSAGSPVERILATSGVPHVVLSPDLDEQTIDTRMIEFLNLPSDPVPASERFLLDFNGRNQAGILAKLLDGMLAARPV
ncbi:MAG TPA: glycosyltransferase [Terriglobales bacterium]|jgi:glycosyltransferase involved in cell wall biosynthesis